MRLERFAYHPGVFEDEHGGTPRTVGQKVVPRQASPKSARIGLHRAGRVRVRPTLYGWILIFLLFWLPMTAAGSANNFLFIVFVMLLGLTLVSHWLGKKNVSAIHLSRRFSDEMFAGAPFPVQYVVNTSFSPWGAVTASYTETAPLVHQHEAVAFARIPFGDPQVITDFFSIASRGEHRIGPGVLRSTFPFGLARYERTCGSDETVLVFPRVEPIREAIPIETGRVARGLERADVTGTVPYHFREYSSGDPYKHIDWKKTSRTGALITRVFSEEGSRAMVVQLPRAASEQAISKAASLVVHCGNVGIPVSLRGPGIMVEAGVGGEFIRRLLTILAKWDQPDEQMPASSHRAGLIAAIDRTGGVTWKPAGGRDVP